MLKRAAYHISSRTGLNRLVRYVFRDRLLVLCYHGVCGAKPDVHDPDGMHVPALLFREQVDLILDHYNAVSLSQLRASIAGRTPLPPRPVLFTFDDGYRNLRRNAFPLLRSRGVTAALFVVPGAIDDGAGLWTARVLWQFSARQDLAALRGELKRMPASCRRRWLAENVSQAPLPSCDHSLMDWEELAAERAAGLVEIGSHGMDHSPLTTCDQTEVSSQLAESHDLIKARLDIDALAVAYPNGDYGPQVVSAAEGAGYWAGFTTGGRHWHDEPPLEIPRVLVGADDDVVRLQARLSGWMGWARRTWGGHH
jgi:peptidoglycan/xylan/chitin deacetylase (PgdA/CDA1 family)